MSTSTDPMPPVVFPATVQGNAQAVVNHIQEFRAEPPRAAFLKSIAALQRYKFLAGVESSEPVFDFGDPEHATSSIAALTHLMSVEDLPPNWRYGEWERGMITALMREGLSLVAKSDSRYSMNLSAVVGSFLFARTGKFLGGSVSDVIGTIWLAPPTSGWTPMKYGENAVHESIHQALFLDDLVHCIFPLSAADMEQRDLVTSAVLKRKRGYDKAFHSAYVALGIADYYRRLGQPWTAEMGALTRTVEELHHGDLPTTMLSVHGQRRLSELAESTATLREIANP